MRRKPLFTKARLSLLAIGLASLVAVANVAVLASAKAASAPGTVDCALILGAGVGEDGTPSWVLQDRLEEGLALYRAGRVKTILVSGDHHTREYDEPNAMRLWLEARAVPPSAIFMDHAGLDTYSSVWRAKHIFGASRLVIVTQRFHLPRALFIARSMGLDAEGAIADRRRYSGAAWWELREVASRTKCLLDVAGGRTPRHQGPRISLDQDGRVTAG